VISYLIDKQTGILFELKALKGGAGSFGDVFVGKNGNRTSVLICSLNYVNIANNLTKYYLSLQGS